MFLELMPLLLCQQANQVPDQKGGAETDQEGAEIRRFQIHTDENFNASKAVRDFFAPQGSELKAYLVGTPFAPFPPCVA
jgi:hypothetical protein